MIRAAFWERYRFQSTLELIAFSAVEVGCSTPDTRPIPHGSRAAPLLTQRARQCDGFPSRREREGKVLEFAKSLFVYHGHAMTEKPLRDLVVVQGFPAAWWLWQHGYRDVVALMGATCSTDQAAAILKLTARTARIWCFTDADKVGEKCAHSLFAEIGRHRFCKWIRASSGQPTECGVTNLAELLVWKIEK